MENTSIGYTACPHDCPSTCALDVEVHADNRVVRVRGAKENSYTLGVICAKVARYSERIHHKDRLLKPLIRKGRKGEGQWRESSWDEALDLIANKIVNATKDYGSASVWPFNFAGTMGLVQRDSINRLRNAGGYSNLFSTFCTNSSITGYYAGTGRIIGVDPREMAKADCIVIWGANVASTQVNVMTHAIKARKERGTKIIAIDVFETATVKQADIGIILKPGSDAAFACALMHIFFQDGYADFDYLLRYSDDPHGLKAHLKTKTPKWAAKITGLSVQEIETVAKLLGTTKKSFFRLGFGFTRQRNGAVAMHAALCVPTVLGSWQYEGGGAFFLNNGIFSINTDEIQGKSFDNAKVRSLEQGKIGRILNNDKNELYGGPPVKVLFVQNTNPLNVAPEQRLVKQGFMREDLFTVVHEHFMTDTAQLADVVLPATMFMEHDDVYLGAGHQHIILGPQVVVPPKGPKSNLEVINALAKRLGFSHLKGFEKTAQELIDTMLRDSNLGTFEELRQKRWLDLQPSFDESHFLNGFSWSDGKFRLKAQWIGNEENPDICPKKPPANMGYLGAYDKMPTFPDHFDVIENADETHPFRLATSPAHNFLNSSFSETPSSKSKEIRPELLMHPQDAKKHSLEDGELIEIGNQRGSLKLHVKIFSGIQQGVVVSKGLFPNSQFLEGEGINILTGADPIAPNGGGAYHDIKIWLKKLDLATSAT